MRTHLIVEDVLPSLQASKVVVWEDSGAIERANEVGDAMYASGTRMDS